MSFLCRELKPRGSIVCCAVRVLFVTKALALLTLVASSCGLSGKIYPAVEDFKPINRRDCQAIENELRLEAERFKTTRLSVFISLESNFERDSLFVVLNAASPDKLRLEVFLPPLNQLLAQVTQNGDKFYAFDVKERVIFEGSAGYKSLEAVLHLPLATDEFISWLTGSFRPPAQASSEDVMMLEHRESGRFLLEYPASEERILSILLEQMETGFKTLGFFVRKKGESSFLLESEYLYAEDADSSSPPAAIRFSLPEFRLDGEIEYDSLESGVSFEGISDRLFELRIPRGVTVRPLGDLSTGIF